MDLQMKGDRNDEHCACGHPRHAHGNKEWHDSCTYCRPGSCSGFHTPPTEDRKESSSRRFFHTGMEIGALVEEKNAAYGSSFAKAGDFLKLLYPDGMKPEQYQDALLLVRIFDKQMRIATKKDALGENPYRDIAGYGILGTTEER
jgi:hypothetical protein